MRERVRGPGCIERGVPAGMVLEAGEVGVRKPAESLARVRREVGVTGRTPVRVEAHTTCVAVDVDKASQKARAAHADGPSGELGRDDRQAVLLPQAILVLHESRGGNRGDERDGERFPGHSDDIGRAEPRLDDSVQGTLRTLAK